jgi:predicted thioesterase
MIEPGLSSEKTWIVRPEHLASRYGSGLVDVLATPVLVGFCEECCRQTVEPLLGKGEKTVGTSISLRHHAATPAGMRVSVRASLEAVDRRRLSFRVEAWDEVEKVAEAEHERFIIDSDRFLRRIAEKAGTVGPQLDLGI